jgi:glycosyltransferase involved in cell wall biosynthesis
MPVFSSQRRVLIVAEALGYGGTESHLVSVLPRLAVAGWNISVFCLVERGARAAELDRAGVPVLTASLFASRSRKRFLYPLQAGLDCSALYAYARHWRPQVAHFFLPRPYLLGAPVAMAAHIPIKIMSRRSLAHYQRNWLGARRLEHLLHSRMDAIVGNCCAVIDELAREGVPQEKLHLIYNGIESSAPALDRGEARAALGLDADVLIGIVVANLIPYKGHRDMIEALAIAAPKLPPSWQILCVGGDNDLRPELEDLAAATGLARNIRFLGQRLDVGSLLPAADFGVLPSRENEGFSNAILESMRAGLAMIVTDVGGNAEAVVDGTTGLVVPPANPKALSAALLRLARDPTLRRRLGDAGRHRVATVFTLDECVANYCALYRELLDTLNKSSNTQVEPAQTAALQ